MSGRGPADHHILGDNTSTATHVLLCALIFVLATPSFNPMLVTMEVLGVPPLAVSTASLLLLAHTVLGDLSTCVFYSVRTFMHSILSIFFRKIEVVGAENIPVRGPIIFTGNHSNQFVDGIQVLCHARHRVGFLIAEKSYNTPIVGHLAKLVGCMPVKRPQDAAAKGTGKLVGLAKAVAALQAVPPGEPSQGPSATVRGVGTKFKSQIAPGDKVRMRGSDSAYKVLSVSSDQELELAPLPKAPFPKAPLPADEPETAAAAQPETKEARKEARKEATEEATEAAAAQPVEASQAEAGAEASRLRGDEGDVAVEFDVLGRVDQAAVFSKVLSFLAGGKCLGIFPEGGSSDRSWFSPGELLTLKPGVAIIVLEALRQHKLTVPVVPVGMQYFDGDKFRGRCVIEFGPPILTPPEVVDEYLRDKEKVGGTGAKATTKLLELIEDGMRGCLVHASSVEDLELMYMFRRLYSRDIRLTAPQKQDLNRRFALWYNSYYLPREAQEGAVPLDLAKLKTDLGMYMMNLKLLGLKDYQIRHLEFVSPTRVVGTILHLVVVLLVSAVPSILLNLPMGLYARIVANKHMAVALAGSNVKVEARDVRLSKMITTCMAGVPMLWLAYAAAMLLAGVSLKHTALYLFWCPFFSYLAVIATEAGMVDLRDLKPLMLRLMVNEKEMDRLVDQRKALQAEVRKMVRKYGPETGELYSAQLGSTPQQNNLAHAAGFGKAGVSKGKPPAGGDLAPPPGGAKPPRAR